MQTLGELFVLLNSICKYMYLDTFSSVQFSRSIMSDSLRPHVLAVAKTAAAAKSLQSCLTLCDPIDGSPPGSAIPGILQTRTLEWIAISVSSA